MKITVLITDARVRFYYSHAYAHAVMTRAKRMGVKAKIDICTDRVRSCRSAKVRTDYQRAEQIRRLSFNAWGA